MDQLRESYKNKKNELILEYRSRRNGLTDRVREKKEN